jgi:hypothetical protein
MNQDRVPRSAMPSIDLMVLVCGVVLFGCAGRLDVIAFWCWLAELAAICVATILIIEPDPGARAHAPWQTTAVSATG